VGIEQADAVGANEAHVVVAGHAQAVVFQRRAGRAGLAEAAADDDGGANAAPADLVEGVGHGRGGHDEHGQIHRVGHFGDGGVDGPLQQPAAARVDEVDGTGVAALGQVAGHAEAELGRGGRSADDDDAGGVKERAKGGFDRRGHGLGL